MRRSPSAAVLLRLLLAAGMLLAGLDLHALQEGGAHADLEPLDGQVEAHGDSCPHHEHLPAHDAHGCVACKAGVTRAAGLLPQSVVRPAAVHVTRSAAADAQRAPERVARGTLGARGPPGTSG